MAQKKVRNQDMEQVEDLVESPEYLAQDIQDKQVVVETKNVAFLVGVNVDNADLVLEEFLVQFQNRYH